MGFSSFAGGALWWGVPFGFTPFPRPVSPLPVADAPLPWAVAGLFPVAGEEEGGVWLRRLAHVSW